MSNEKPRTPFAVMMPPFAVVVISRSQDGSEDAIRVDVDGVELLGSEHSEGELQRVAAVLNEHVAARESKLCGALQAVLRFVDSVAVDGNRPIRAAIEGLGVFCRAALDGAGPEYVPEDVANALAFDLGQAQETIRQLALIIDAMDAERVAQVAPFLEAMGLRKPPGELYVLPIPAVEVQAVMVGNRETPAVAHAHLAMPIMGPLELVLRRPAVMPASLPNRPNALLDVARWSEETYRARAAEGLPDLLCEEHGIYGNRARGDSCGPCRLRREGLSELPSELRPGAVFGERED